MENVAALSSCRGKGIGGRLLPEAIDLCWKADCYKIMLMSGSQNLRAHRFYQDRGFKTTKTGFELRKPGYPVRKIR
ncbi:GNAT family N-acetyltransferase [Roseibium album]|uniref:GNAT family N-acetyltransferase n=1 Tax=Roseibium album TaxID=311410 RepID=UPI003CD0C67C